MKRLLSILVWLPFLYGCRQSQTYHQLTEIDSLLRQEMVDSAMQKLCAIAIDSNDTRTKAYYYLLKTQALYKGYQFINTDSLINISYDYYKDTGEKDKLARTLLYRGNLRTDMGQVLEAMEDYKKAEGIIENLDDDVLRHNVYFMISHIYSILTEYSLAIDYLEKAKTCAAKAGRNDYLVYDHKQTAVVFYKMAEYDSSLYYTNKSIQAINLIPKKPAETRAHIWTSLGVTCFMLNDLENARHALEKSITIKPLATAYAALARIYLKEKDTTKAIKLLEEGLKVPDTKTSGMNITNLLSKIEQNRGNYQHAAELSQRAYAIKDSLAKQQQAENKKAVQIAFERRTDNEQAAVVRRWLWTGIVFLTLIGGAAVVVLTRRSYRTKRQLTEEQRRVEQLSEEKRQTDKELNKAQKMVSRMKRDQQTQQQTIKNQQKIWQQHELAMERGHRLFMALNSGSKTIKWTHDDFKDFKTYYDSVESTFAEKITQNYGQLSNNLYLIAVLEHLGKNDDEIMAITGQTTGALRTARSRLNQKKQNE